MISLRCAGEDTRRVIADLRGLLGRAWAKTGCPITTDHRDTVKYRSPMEAIAQRYWTTTSSSRQNTGTIEVP
jgi:hypothetical protein